MGKTERTNELRQFFEQELATRGYVLTEANDIELGTYKALNFSESAAYRMKRKLGLVLDTIDGYKVWRKRTAEEIMDSLDSETLQELAQRFLSIFERGVVALEALAVKVNTPQPESNVRTETRKLDAFIEEQYRGISDAYDVSAPDTSVLLTEGMKLAPSLDMDAVGARIDKFIKEHFNDEGERTA